MVSANRLSENVCETIPINICEADGETMYD